MLQFADVLNLSCVLHILNKITFSSGSWFVTFCSYENFVKEKRAWDLPLSNEMNLGLLQLVVNTYNTAITNTPTSDKAISYKWLLPITTL